MFSLIICMLVLININQIKSHPECIRVNNRFSDNKFVGIYKYYCIENGYPVYHQIRSNIQRTISIKSDEYTFTFSGENKGPHCLDRSIPESPIKCSQWTDNLKISISECDASIPKIARTHSNISTKRRLNVITGKLCVFGDTVDPIYWPKSDDSFKRYIYIQGDYSYGGVDSNDNDYWVMTYDGNSCYEAPYTPDPFPINFIYIRKSTKYNTYEISTRLSEGYSISICNDNNIQSPDECNSWSNENLGSVNSNNAVRIIKDGCPDMQTEKKLIASDVPFCRPGDGYYGCNGEFIKDGNLLNVYNGETNTWYFDYPIQKWMCIENYCKNGECFYDGKSSDVRKWCMRYGATRYDGTKLVFE